MASAASIPLQTASGTPGLPSGSQVPLGMPVDPSRTGGPPAPDTVASYVPSEDTVIPGAMQINPAFAGDFYAGRFLVQRPIPGNNEPAMVKDRLVSQYLASSNSPNFWDKQTLPATSDAVRYGPGKKAQAPLNSGGAGTPIGGRPLGANPAANRKFIPPLALFNDAAQWVNRLMFNQPMTWFDAATSNPPLKAQYYSPPPINTHNLAAATLNLQMQLGRMAIQAQQLSISASNYFG